jgi:hypothetical protein
VKRFTSGLIFGAAVFAIALSAGAGPLWSAVVGLAAGAVAAALT